MLTSHDELLTLNQIAYKLNISPQTLYNWERKGLIQPHINGQLRLFSLAAARAVRAPDGYVPLPVASERLSILTRLLRKWETQGRIPPFVRVSERRTCMLESDIPRVRAWYMWSTRTQYNPADYPLRQYDLWQAQNNVDGFEKAIAAGAIPERFSAAHYDPRGWRFETRQHDQREG